MNDTTKPWFQLRDKATHALEPIVGVVNQAKDAAGEGTVLGFLWPRV